MSAIPSYAVDLLLAAKSVARPPSNATPEMLGDHLDSLCDAVNAFEKRMPIADGTIQEGEANPAFDSDACGRRLAADAMMDILEGIPLCVVSQKFASFLLMEAWGEEPKRENASYFEGFLNQLFEIAQIARVYELQAR